MSHVMFLGNLEGGSELHAGGQNCGKVRHSLRVYQDAQRDTIVAAGKVWCDDLVLQHATVGQTADLRLEDGQTLRIVVRQKSMEKKYLCVGVDGAVPGY